MTSRLQDNALALTSGLILILCVIALPNSYAVAVAGVLILIWLLYGKQLSTLVLQFPGGRPSAHLDNVLLLLAPLMYLAVASPGWIVTQLKAPADEQPAILVIVGPEADVGLTKRVITDIWTTFGDYFGGKFTVFPRTPALDGDNWWKDYRLHWDAVSRRVMTPEFARRTVEVVRGQGSANAGRVTLVAFIRAYDTRKQSTVSAYKDFPAIVVSGPRADNEELLALLLSYQLVKRYLGTSITVNDQQRISAEFALRFANSSGHLKNNLPGDLKLVLDNPQTCSDLRCVDNLSDALKTAVAKLESDPTSAQASQAQAVTARARLEVDRGPTK